MPKIVIEYEKETVDTDNFTEREKAIYKAGYEQGINSEPLGIIIKALLSLIICFAILYWIAKII